jgi:hypothetical protein
MTLDALKKQIHEAQLHAQRAVKSHLVDLFSRIGRLVLRQEEDTK